MLLTIKELFDNEIEPPDFDKFMDSMDTVCYEHGFEVRAVSTQYGNLLEVTQDRTGIVRYYTCIDGDGRGK